MLDTLANFAGELWRNFRAADAIDILLIAVVIYCALIWFGETTSRRMLVGVTLLAALYLAARLFDMHLTSLAFHTGFTVLLILLIVVFQEDLRRIVSRAAVWMSLPRAGASRAASELDVLAESAFSLAKRRIGALIVLPGIEPLERHFSGGVPLDGRLSGPLLDSIFDPSSAGHDGAAVVVGERLTQFGVHLPISSNPKAIHGRGTRHCAAVGLSECSDAQVIVVSEERGVVSLAKGGHLREIDTSATLLRQLQQSSAHRTDEMATSAWTRHITAHWRMKVLALSMSMIAWFVLAYNPATVTRSFRVPIEYRNVPADLSLDHPISEAQLTLSGSAAGFRFVAPESLKISIDLSQTSAGNHTVELGPENIDLPTGVSIESIDPDSLWLYLRGAPKKPDGANSP